VSAPSRASRAVARLRALWLLIRHEHATPREIGQAVAVGVLSGCTPAIGFHGAIALGMATLLRLNRLWAFLGSRVSNFLVLPWIVLSEIEVSHRVRTGAWAPLDVDTVLHQAPGLLLDWLVGTLVVGSALASVLGLIAYAIASRVRPVTAPPEADLTPSEDQPRP
jgi:uncharacterized protein (DUF2062 family)